MNELKIRAKIYSAGAGDSSMRAFANVDIGGLMYINSCSITTSKERPDILNVFLPSYSHRTGVKKPYVEFPQGANNRLVAAIKKACLVAYKDFENTGELHKFAQEFTVKLDDLIAPDPINQKESEISIDEIDDNFDIQKELDALGF